MTGRYVGQLFRDRNVFQYITLDRTQPATLQAGLLFFIFALKYVGALSPDDLDSLYSRFVVDNEQDAYWRAYWEGIRHVMLSLDTEIFRTAILAQIDRTPWWKLCFESDIYSTAIIQILSTMVDSIREHTMTIKEAIPGLDVTPIIKTMQILLQAVFANDIDDNTIAPGLTDLLLRLFPFYPTTGDERNHLADRFFQNASSGPINQRGGDLQILRALLLTETSEIVTGWNREECVSRLCSMTPSLPEVILDEFTTWKVRQYQLGFEHAQRSAQVEFRVQFLLHVLNADRNVGGTFQFSRETLEGFWNNTLMRTEEGGLDQWWGGDCVTETVRIIFFHILASVEFQSHSGLVCEP